MSQATQVEKSGQVEAARFLITELNLETEEFLRSLGRPVRPHVLGGSSASSSSQFGDPNRRSLDAALLYWPLEGRRVSTI